MMEVTALTTLIAVRVPLQVIASQTTIPVLKFKSLELKALLRGLQGTPTHLPKIGPSRYC